MDCVARPFRSGDEESLVALWNRAHARYGGYIPRTKEFWSWNILQRPGIRRDDIVLVTRGTPVEAFGVLGPDGAVLEFAVDTGLGARVRKKACRTLIRALEERARSRGDEGVAFTGPGDDRLIVRELGRAGYRSRRRDRLLCLGILDACAIVGAALNYNKTRLPRDWSRSFSLEILPGDYRVSPQRWLEIVVRQGESTARARAVDEKEGVDCALRMDLVTLSEIVFTRLPFGTAVNEGRICIVSGDTSDAETLCLALSLDIPWYSPPSDLY